MPDFELQRKLRAIKQLRKPPGSNPVPSAVMLGRRRNLMAAFLLRTEHDGSSFLCAENVLKTNRL